MKVAFWSNAYEKSGAFFNFAAVSIASVMGFPYKVTVFENYLDKDNLGKAFFVNRKPFTNRSGIPNFYEGNGIEGLLRRIYRGDNYPGLLKNYLQEVIPKHLYYIPQNGVINSELFDYELYYNQNELFKMIENNSDLCFINVYHQNHLSSNAILEEADLIVVNLYQNQEYLNDFFSKYSSFIHKAMFIVGNYSPKSVMSCKRIAKLYEIPLEDISPIPYNEDFHMACNYGGAKEFIISNYFCGKENPNYLFIHGVRRAAFILTKKIEEPMTFSNKEMKHCGT